ncbi:MAG: hypothetical protein NTZ42_04840 [Candidatus Gribaldobacteria bacterium]|nr:hypothetical protein [Candidatus Gribaldobacteria bacterium]
MARDKRKGKNILNFEKSAGAYRNPDTDAEEDYKYKEEINKDGGVWADSLNQKEISKCLEVKGKLNERSCLFLDDLKSVVNLEDSNSLIATFKIKRIIADETSCGVPNNQQIIGDFNLYLVDKYYNILEKFNLSDATLLQSEYAGDPLLEVIDDKEIEKFYQPWDIDGDGKKEEFVVQEYGSCNGNIWKFMKYNQNNKKIENILFVNDKGDTMEEIFVNPGKDAIKISDGLIEYNNYDNASGNFSDNVYKFDAVKNSFQWQKP